MNTYRVDPLHPDRLVCEICGEAVAAVPPDLAADLSGTVGLTRRQLGRAGRCTYPDGIRTVQLFPLEGLYNATK
jgi:hypothetical protein